MTTRLAIVLVLMLPALACAKPKMLFVGDSITLGLRATNPDRDGFVALLDERFTEFRLANVGCFGSTVRDWTNDEPAQTCALGGAWGQLAEPELPAQITHILLGTNDASSVRDPISPSEYELRMRLLVARAPGLVLISTPPRRREPNAFLQSYRDIIFKIVASSRRVELGADFYQVLDPFTDIPDGIHPDDRGHARMADALERRILELLPRFKNGPPSPEAPSSHSEGARP